jgi:outer membrane protein
MKVYLCGLLSLLGLHLAHAQNPVQLSLQKARELALKNRFDVQANAYDIEIARTEILRKKQAFVPDVRLTGSLSYHPQIQAVLVPPGFIGTTEPSLIALGANSISVYNLELNQPIINAAMGTDIKIAQNSALLQQERNRAREIEIKHRVGQAYFNVLLKGLQNEIASDEQRRFEEYYTMAEGRYKNGALIENEYLRAQLDLENARQQAAIAQQQSHISVDNLRYELNLPANTVLELTDSLGQNMLFEAVALDTTYMAQRTELRQLEFEKVGIGLQIKRQRQAVMPVLSFTANYAQQYQNIGFNFNYGKGQSWSPFSAVGLKLSVPLTDHFTNKANVSQLRLKEGQTQARLLQQQTEISHEITQSYMLLANARINVNRTMQNYELAKRIYLSQQQQLELGAFSYDALLNTSTSMAEAERNYITASYEFFVASLNYEKAIGK